MPSDKPSESSPFGCEIPRACNIRVLVMQQLISTWLESRASYEFRASGKDLALFSALLAVTLAPVPLKRNNPRGQSDEAEYHLILSGRPTTKLKTANQCKELR